MNFDWSNIYHFTRDALELLSFIGTTLLGLFGFFIFRQLRTAQETLETAKAALEVANADIQTRIDREAVVLAAQQADRFAKELLPKMGPALTRCRQLSFARERWELNNPRFDQLSLKDQDSGEKWVNELATDDIGDEIIGILNEYESFAMYFVGGAANEELAFPSLASVYCSNIETIAPLLVSLRFGWVKKAVSAGPYQNLVTLYEIWSTRLKSQELETEAARLLEERAGIHTSSIPVLGKKQ